MKITIKEKETDPAYPLMHGSSSFAKEFNKRQADLYIEGKGQTYDYEQVTTVLLEILIDDFNKKKARKKTKTVKDK